MGRWDKPAPRSEYLGFSGSKHAKFAAKRALWLTATLRAMAWAASTADTSLQKIMMGPLYLRGRADNEVRSASEECDS